MTYPRETLEYVTVAVTVDGLPVVQGVQFSVVRQEPTATELARPDVWTDAVIIDGKTAFLIEPQEPGVLQVWTRYGFNAQGDPEIPVDYAGSITID